MVRTWTHRLFVRVEIEASVCYFRLVVKPSLSPIGTSSNSECSLIELTFLFDVWFQEFKIKVKTGVFFFHVLFVDSHFFRMKILTYLLAGSSIDLSAGKICRPRGTPGFFHGILAYNLRIRPSLGEGGVKACFWVSIFLAF